MLQWKPEIAQEINLKIWYVFSLSEAVGGSNAVLRNFKVKQEIWIGRVTFNTGWKPQFGNMKHCYF